MFGFKARRLAADLAFEKHRTELLRQQLEDAGKERDSWKWTATQTIGSHDDLVIRRTRERDEARRLLATAEDGLAAARKRLEGFGHALTVPEVLEQHDVHRKALADALGEGWHLNWDQLIASAAQTRETADERTKDRIEQQRVIDRMTEQLFDAFGYAPGDRQRLGLPVQEVTT